MRASFAPRPGAAPRVAFDAGGAALESRRSPGSATRRSTCGMDDAAFLTDPVFSERASPLLVRGSAAAGAAGRSARRAARRSTSRCSRTTTTTTPTCRRSGALAARGVPLRGAAGVASWCAAPAAAGGGAGLVGERRGRGRDGPLRARPPLLRPRPHRPQPPPVGGLRGVVAHAPLLPRGRHRATSTASPRSGDACVPIDLACLPDRRLPAARDDAARPPRSRGGRPGRARPAAHARRWACTSARSTSRTSRSTSRPRASWPRRPARGLADARACCAIGETRAF